jgi:electron transfer flavoprotein alpha subunit
MAQIVVLERKCTGCQVCLNSCPFGAIRMVNGQPVISEACRLCNICVKNCPEKALMRLETKAKSVDKSKWQGVLVFAEAVGGALHPVSLELIGKGRQLAGVVGQKVQAIILGDGIQYAAEELRHYGVEKVAVYDDPALGYFRADVYADCVADYIRLMKPSVVLIGATSLGRSLAPRLSTRFRTGLTADCTQLEMKGNTDLVQIRPAFGGNIMAQIVTESTRPQFATVRYKVMDAPVRDAVPAGQILHRSLPGEALQSKVSLVKASPVKAGRSISDAQILVVGGRGLKKESDLDMIRQLASLLGGDWAVSRPLVEKGWAPAERQIGLSGRTVRPKLLIACGVSGAIQFTACMNASEKIIAINSDPDAPIFEVAHLAAVGDLYQVVPGLIARLSEDKEVQNESV